MDDKRIYLFKNISDLQKNDTKTEINEYEILTDASVNGKFHFGPYNLKIWDMNNQVDHKQRLYLKVRETENVITKEELNSGDLCYGYPHDAASEIIDFASLFLRRRFWISSHLFTNHVPIPKIPNSGFKDPDLVKGVKNLKNLPECFELISNLDEKYQKRFLTAAKFYRRALLTLENEPDMAYLHLVTSIEALSGKTKSKINTMKEFSAELAEIMGSIEDIELKEKIEKLILEKEFVTSKFVEFILEHVEDDFWKNTNCYGKIKPDELENILKKIYKQRSNTLHNGDPFPVNIYYPPNFNEEIPDHGVRSGTNRCSAKNIIPYPHFFEQLVNHVLINYLKRNQVPQE